MHEACLNAKVKVQPGYQHCACEGAVATSWKEGSFSSLYNVDIEDESIDGSHGDSQVAFVQEKK